MHGQNPLMDWTRYHFQSRWPLPADPAVVYEALERVEDYPRWWRQVREVNWIDGTTGVMTIRSLLPYDMTFTAREVRRDPAAGILEIAMSGDLEGWARWTISAYGTGSLARYEQVVDVNKPLLGGSPCRDGRSSAPITADDAGRAARSGRLPGNGLKETRRDLYCSVRSRAISSVGERFVHTEEVTGSNPVSPTGKGRSA